MLFSGPMNETELQTEEQYAAIGRFVVKFEHLHHEMASMMKAILGVNGLNSRFAAPLIAGLAAEPLRKSLLALLMAHLGQETERAIDPGNEEDSKCVIENTFNRIKTLIQEHSTMTNQLWLIGQMNTEQSASCKDLAPLSAEADELTTILRRLFQWIFMNVLEGNAKLNSFVLVDEHGAARPRPLGAVAEAMTVQGDPAEAQSSV